MRRLIAAIALVCAVPTLAAGAASSREAPSVAPARVIARLPHDPAAFTEGLFIRDGKLYESTGLEGHSTIREIDLATGRREREILLPPNLFGEGIVDWGDEIVSVTWTTGIGFRWDRTSFKRIATFRYPGQGWGMTHDTKAIILSDGTATLRFLDPETFALRRRLDVTAGGRPVTNLNELEWVHGEILANVWNHNVIARIDPSTGHVKGWIDIAALAAEMPSKDIDAVANGIAYDRATDRLYITGKDWPTLFQIALPTGPSADQQ